MGGREMMLAVGIPGAVGLAVLVGAALLAGRKRADGAARALGWLVVLLAGAAVVMGSYAWQSRVALWPDSVTQRFPFVALVAVVVGLLGVFVFGRRRWASGAVAAVGGGMVAWAFLSELHGSLISEPARWGWIVGSGVLAGVMAWVLEAAGGKLDGWRGPTLLAGLIGMTGLGVTEAVVGGPLLLGGAAAVFGASAVAGIVRWKVAWFPGPGAASAVLMVGVLVFANWFGDRERWVMFGLVAAGPMAAGVCLLPAVAKRGPNVRFAVAALVVLVVLGVQAGRAVPPLMEAMRPSGEMDYEY